MATNLSLRKQIVKNCKRVVIKAGTRLLTYPDVLASLIREIDFVRRSGRQVIFVSSGAVGTAMKMLSLERRPKHLSDVQALAAMGQVRLMAEYETECAKYGFKSAQLLLTADDLRSRERHLNTLNCIEALLARDVLPIINENDPVSVDELKFGDNDFLASLLGSMTRSDLTIILTTVDGLLRPNPDGTLGSRIPLVQGVTREQKDMATGTDDGSMSIGGMISKVKAAEILNAAGESLLIASGRTQNVLEKIFAGEDVGTLFVPPEGVHKLEAKKRWIMSFSKISGRIKVDSGAVAAIRRKNGSSLLPSGVTSVEGTFKRGDIVEIVSSGNSIVGRGVTNFSSSECRKIAGKHSEDLRSVLGFDAEDEVIHRNNMAVL